MWLLILAALVGTVIGSCPPGSYFLAHSHKCITVVTDGTKYGYFQAEVACHKKGGHLASIGNLLDNAIMFALAKGESLNETAFIGAISKDGVWKWNAGDAVNFTNWAEGQPIDGQDCAVMSLTDSLWYSNDCNQRDLPYFCELQPGARKPVCPPNWEMYQGSCYLYNEADSHNATWTDAKRECVSRGGNLASIHSVEEDTFLKGLLTTDYCNHRPTAWIGLYDPSGHSRSGLKWSDDTKVAYTPPSQNYNNYHYQAMYYYMNGRCEDVEGTRQTGTSSWVASTSPETERGYVCKRTPILECPGGRVPLS